MTTSSSTNGHGSTAATSSSDGWLWMQHAKSRVEDPIPPLDVYDKRPAVRDLIHKHAAAIEKLRAKLQNDDPLLWVPTKHDDLWLLRFLLSHGLHVSKAYDAAHSTLLFRQTYQLDDVDIRHIVMSSASLLQAAADWKDRHPRMAQYLKSAGKMMGCYLENDTMVYYKVPEDGRSIIGFMKLAERNQHGMAAALTEEEYFEAHLVFSEWKYQWLDFHTRTTGRLTKYMSIADCSHVHLSMLDKDSKRKDGNAAKRMENQYPQILGLMALCHTPTWITMVFVMMKPFVPKRLMAKVAVIKLAPKPTKNAKHDHPKDLDRLREYCSIDSLPEKYGGNVDEWPPTSDLSRA